VIFGGIFCPIFDLTICEVFLRFLLWLYVIGRASSYTSKHGVNPWL
jgi:hypothetical protein